MGCTYTAKAFRKEKVLQRSVGRFYPDEQKYKKKSPFVENDVTKPTRTEAQPMSVQYILCGQVCRLPRPLGHGLYVN